ncbi:hypothetical protein [Lawsonibacter sp. JLR.KK007]|uniref:hypothetical protein n=1 Tax=Lawsonibacter sp. JLR.KK007 TaxID=3114293 RepID=UPI002FEEBBE3
MNQRLDDYNSSQRSPRVPCIQLQLRKPKTGMYSYMFLEDFCSSFSIALAPRPLSRGQDFYRISPSGDLLKSLLCFEDDQFLKYDMDKLLTDITQALISFGKAYLEIITWRDAEGIIKGISFALVKPVGVLKGINRTLFVSIQFDKKFKLYHIENRNLIILRLKDLGYSRHSFRNFLRKINKCDFTNVSEMSLYPQKTGFNFSRYKSKSEFALLKATKSVYWYGRDGKNQYMGESYLLYRAARFTMLRKKFLIYIIQQINKGLQNHKQEIGFNGELAIDCEEIDYMKEFERLWTGEINTTQLSKLVFRI